MNTATFDTHQAVKTITSSGLNDSQAEAIVTTIGKAMHQNFATKSDFVILKADVETLKADVGTLKTDMVAVKGDLLVVKWMVGLVIAVEALPFLKFLFA